MVSESSSPDYEKKLDQYVEECMTGEGCVSELAYQQLGAVEPKSTKSSTVGYGQNKHELEREDDDKSYICKREKPCLEPNELPR